MLLDTISNGLARIARIGTIKTQSGGGGIAPTSRALHPPVPVVPDSALQFGPGIGAQPPDATLLKFNRGTPKVASRAIANRVASLRPQVKSRIIQSDGTTDDQLLPGHPLQTLLDSPHPDFTRAMLLSLIAEWYTVNGSAYLQKIGNGLNVPAELSPIPPQSIRPLVDRYMISAYEVTDGDGAITILDRDEVIRIFRPDPANIFGGEGFLGPNGVESDAARFQHEHMRAHFERNATPPILLEASADSIMPGKPERERFLEEWVQGYNRRLGTKRGGPMMLPPGFSAVQMAMQTGQDITPLLEYYDRQQLKAWGVPASILGEVVSGDRSSAETNQYVFDRHAILPIATAIEQALTRQLAIDFDPRLVVEFEAFVQRDKDFDLKVEQADLQAKTRTINEVRDERGEESVEWGDLPVGSIGDEPYDGKPRESMSFIATDPDADPEPDTDPEFDDGPEDEPDDEVRIRYAHTVRFETLFGAKFQNRLKQIMAKQQRATVARFRKIGLRTRAPGDGLFDIGDWTGDFAREIFPLYREVIQRAGTDVLSQIIGGDAVPFVFSEQAARAIRQEAAALVTRTGATTKKAIARELAEAVEAGESERKMVQRLNRVFDKRKRDTRTIARTEVGKAVTVAALEGARQSGVVTHKRWLHSGRTGDPRHGHLNMNRDTIPIDDLFSWQGEDGRTYEAAGPRASNLPASEVVNCQCDLSFPRVKKATT